VLAESKKGEIDSACEAIVNDATKDTTRSACPEKSGASNPEAIGGEQERK
jgi:hypothetical protein